jgi:hypothetical protein
MEGALRTESPDDLLFIWGKIKAEGFADDDAVEIDEVAQLYEDTAGVDGEVTRIKNKDRRATMVVRLAATSPTNAELSIMRELDKAGRGILPFTVKGSGTSVYSGAKCWISKSPKIVMGRQGKKVMEWTFRVAKLDRFDGFVAPS